MPEIPPLRVRYQTVERVLLLLLVLVLPKGDVVTKVTGTFTR